MVAHVAPAWRCHRLVTQASPQLHCDQQTPYYDHLPEEEHSIIIKTEKSFKAEKEKL